MKKLSYTLLISFLALSAWGQSEQIFTHFMFNRLNFNPAYAGSKEVLDMDAIYRRQWWSGIPGTPTNFNLSAHMPFAKLRNGIGLNLMYDKIGLHRIWNAGLSYAYRIKFSEGKNTLALGLSGRVEGATARWSERNAAVEDETTFIDDSESKTTFNFGPGVYFNNRHFYLGVSVPRLLRNSLYQNKDEFSSKVNTYFAQAGLVLNLGQNLQLQPNAQVRYNPHAPFDFDVNANLWFFQRFMIGANYRYEDSIDGLVQFRFNNGLRLGFAMDFTTSDLNQATTGSYEILAGYTFPCEDCVIKSLRFF